MSEKQRKFTDKQYEDFEYFEDDDLHTSHEQKLVVTRKEQVCSSIFSDPHPIAPKTKAIREKAIEADAGWVSNYICLDCADQYFEEAGVEDYI